MTLIQFPKLNLFGYNKDSWFSIFFTKIKPMMKNKKLLFYGILGVVALAIVGVGLFVLNRSTPIKPPEIIPASLPPETPLISPPRPPQETEPAPEVNCPEKVEYFLSKVPGCFKSVEKGIEWCNECHARNGVPALSYDVGPFCNLKTPDAGKICTDSGQCKGICLAENENSKSGKCSDTESVLGCVFEMTNGESLERCFD